MMKERLVTLSLVAMLATMALAACGPGQPAVEEPETVSSAATQAPAESATGTASPATPSDPVTLHDYRVSEIPTLDPQVAAQVLSVNYIENLFVNLTNRDPETLELVPEAAESWESQRRWPGLHLQAADRYPLGPP